MSCDDCANNVKHVHSTELSESLQRCLDGDTLVECAGCSEWWPASGLVDGLCRQCACPHVHTHVERSNSGDGTPRYDVHTLWCDDCDKELGDA